MEHEVMVIFQPAGKRGNVKKSINIIEASRELGVDIENLCGGVKACGKCKVRIEEGFFQKLGINSTRLNVTPWQEEEGAFINQQEKFEGYRLGCCTNIIGDILIFVPEESRAGKPVVSKTAREIPIVNNPSVNLYYIEVPEPSLGDPLGDFERLCGCLKSENGLSDLSIDFFALRKLPECLRDGDWKVTVSVWMDKEIIRIRPGKVDHHYGMAIDVGTTTVAIFLCDLSTNQVIDTRFFMNPQCKYGEDVMSRITYHILNEGGLQRMSDDLLDALNKSIRESVLSTHPPKKIMKKEATTDNGEKIIEKEAESPEEEKEYLRLTLDDIEDITLVGNTAMHHILFQLNPKYLAYSPFPPVIHHSLDIKARDLGLKVNTSAYVHVLPIKAGFVGADNVAVLIAEEPHNSEEMHLIIDIGTNGELVLGNRHRLISSSCATGPAFEGAQIAFGMRAAPGAIERIEIDPETQEVDYKVIGKETWKNYSNLADMRSKGICGSGILDVLAELYRSGVINKGGAFNRKLKSGRFRVNTETKFGEFVIAWANETKIGKDIVITQKDIRQIQLAKGAIYCGCKLMMKRLGIDKIDLVKIAGAFGSHIDKVKALIMGLFHDIAIDQIICVGNAAGDGARIALLNKEKRKEAEQISRNIEYMELTVEKDFQNEFMEAMAIPHSKDLFPHLEGVVSAKILHQK